MPSFQLTPLLFRSGSLRGTFRVKTKSIPPERPATFRIHAEEKSIVFSLGDETRPGPRDSVFHGLLDEFCRTREEFVNRSAEIKLDHDELVIQAVNANGALCGHVFRVPFVSPALEAFEPARQIYLGVYPSDELA